MQLLFILPDPSSRFLRMPGEWVGYSQEHWSPFNVACKTAFIQSFDPEALAGMLRRRGLSYRAHQEREAGFMQLLAEQYPQLQVLDLREGYDDERTNYRQTRALLEQHPDLAAIYNIGGGAGGVGRGLKESGGEMRVVFIGHGLTPDTRALLIDGTMDAVINQSPQNTILSSVRIFTNLRDRREMMSGVEVTRSQVIFRENLP